jgi:uncharacterized protein (TIGR03083 family)
MRKPSTDVYFGEIRSSAGRLAEIVTAYDPELRVPTCPDWNLGQLATHVGRVHRWAAEIVRTRAAERIPFDSVPDGKFPASAAGRAAWINAGAARVVDAIVAADNAPVWAFGRQAPASFWARRQAHETAMHRIDAELAVGRTVVLDEDLAADGVDEWLATVTSPLYRGRDGMIEALPAGAALHLRATTPGQPDEDTTADWVIRSTGDGVSLQRGPDRGDVSICGPADRLLLALVRRAQPDATGLTVTGDVALFSGWLASTPF